MTTSRNNSTSPRFSNTYRRSSVFAMKARYQRNMLIGLAVAAIVVVAPAVLAAYWPMSSAPGRTPPFKTQPMVMDKPNPLDTVVVDRDREILVVFQHPVVILTQETVRPAPETAYTPKAEEGGPQGLPDVIEGRKEGGQDGR